MIEKMRIICLLSFFLIGDLSFTGCISEKVTGRAYHLSPSGSDDSKGTIHNPWRSIERINRMILKPGDTILFEAGRIFPGTFFMDSLDSGDKNHLVTIGSYGEGRAVIDGGDSEGIVIENCRFFRINNLAVKGSGRKTGNRSDGIIISASDTFEVSNLEISGFQHSGIHIIGSRNAKIIGVIAHDNGFAGIHVSGKRVNDPVVYENENLNIRDCKAYNNPGDPTVLNNHSGNGILAASVNGGTIEYCEAFDNGWDMPWTGNGPVGIWIWDCNDVTIQYCMSHDNKTNPVAADGGGFDFDGGVSNSLIQYCLSWSNQGAGYGLFEFGASKVWENNVVRYNISRNDGIRNGGSLSVWKGENGGTMRNCAVYNNTFYNDTVKGISLWIISPIQGFTYLNNIFVYSGSFLGEKQKLTCESFSGNCYWNLPGKSSVNSFDKLTGIFSDPKLEDPVKDIINDPRLMNEANLSGFFLTMESPLAGKGVDPGSPFNFTNQGIGLAGIPVKHGNEFDIGAIGYKRGER